MWERKWLGVPMTTTTSVLFIPLLWLPPFNSEAGTYFHQFNIIPSLLFDALHSKLLDFFFILLHNHIPLHVGLYKSNLETITLMLWLFQRFISTVTHKLLNRKTLCIHFIPDFKDVSLLQKISTWFGTFDWGEKWFRLVWTQTQVSFVLIFVRPSLLILIFQSKTDSHTLSNFKWFIYLWGSGLMKLRKPWWVSLHLFWDLKPSPLSFSPQNNNPHEWLQVDLGKVHRITGVVTQGARSLLTQMMVTEFSVTVSSDGQSWNSVLEENSRREKVQLLPSIMRISSQFLNKIMKVSELLPKWLKFLPPWPQLKKSP